MINYKASFQGANALDFGSKHNQFDIVGQNFDYHFTNCPCPIRQYVIM